MCNNKVYCVFYRIADKLLARCKVLERQLVLRGFFLSNQDSPGYALCLGDGILLAEFFWVGEDLDIDSLCAQL